MPSVVEVLLSLIGVLFFLIVGLLGLLYRAKFTHIKDQQGAQDRRADHLDRRLDALEKGIASLGDSVGRVDKDNVRNFEQVRSLTETLEHYFQELKAEIEKQGSQMSRNLKVYRDDDEKAHKAILDRLDDKLQRQKR